MASKKQKQKFELVEMNPDHIKTIDKQNLKEADWIVLVQMGQDAGEVKTYAQWILGKLGDAVMQKYGDLKKYANEINQKYEVLQQYMNVYRKFIAEDPDFHPSKYAGSIPWGVLQIAASKSDTPQMLVDELHDKGATGIDSATRALKGNDIPKKPVISLHWDPEVKKYKIFILQKELELIDWADMRQTLMDYLEALK